jgi:hypothetical protein
MEDLKEVGQVEVYCADHTLLWLFLSVFMFLGGFEVYPNYVYPLFSQTSFMLSLVYYYFFFVGFEILTGVWVIMNILHLFPEILWYIHERKGDKK